MLANFFKIALRNLWRNKSYTLINLFGLSIGITASLLIIIFILFEFSYDRFHQNKNSLYRISVKHKKEGNIEYESPVYTPPIGPAMKQEFPEVEDFVRISTPRSVFIHHQGDVLRVNQACYADTSFFKLFSFRLLAGNPNTVLSEPFSIVLTQEIANKLFHDAPPLNQIVTLNQRDQFRVTGIVASPPVNSSIRFDALLSFSTLYRMSDVFMGWNGGNQYVTYVKLNEQSDPTSVRAKLPDLMWRKINKYLASVGVADEAYLQPLSKVHIIYDLSGGNILFIIIYSAIAALILLMACVNFINLTTALSIRRAKEVGVRKVMGAGRTQIVLQHLTESTLLSFFSLILAAFFIELIFPIYLNLVGKAIPSSLIVQPKYLLAIIGFIGIIGLLAGSYPAFYISSVQIIRSIKGVSETRREKRGVRNVLLVFQFMISVILIICTVFLQKQLIYMNRKELGFNKENILILPLSYQDVQQEAELLKRELLRLKDIQLVTACSEVPIRGFTRNGYFPEGMQTPMMIHVVDVDEDFLQLFEIPLVQGRNFSREIETDNRSYLINETLARQLNWQNPIGKWIRRGVRHPVIGVVKDFHYATLYNRIEPLIITRHPFMNRYSNLAIKLKTKNYREAVAAIYSVWKKIAGNAPFEYYFFDDAFQHLYQAEKKSERVFAAFSVIAFFISLLGLYSLSSYATQQRTKEVGIRKVLGASVPGIIGLFSKDFVKLVIVADGLAFPISWFAMKTILQNYAYHISMGWITFVLAGLISLTIALTTVTLQSFKTATANPVEALRYE